MTLFAQPTVARSIALLLGLTTMGLAQASEEAVKKGMESFIGAPAVESVTKTPYGGCTKCC